MAGYGASIAFYHQHPEHLASRRRELRLSARLKERLGLIAGFLIGRGYLEQGRLWSAEELAREAAVPLEAMEEILTALKARDLLTMTKDDPPEYVPARALETITIRSVLDAVRTAEEAGNLAARDLPFEHPVDQLLRTLDDALDEALASRTLRDLAGGSEPKLQTVTPNHGQPKAPPAPVEPDPDAGSRGDGADRRKTR